MPRYYGNIGYVDTVEARPGIWEEVITERKYQGDLTRNTRKISQGNDKINDNINFSMDISIIADPYAFKNFHKIKYITYMGSKWKVSNIQVQFPRLILYISELYNEQEAENTDGQ